MAAITLKGVDDKLYLEIRRAALESGLTVRAWLLATLAEKVSYKPLKREWIPIEDSEVDL